MQLDRLKAILKDFEAKKVLVIGDVMIDHYLWGYIERISPEAPVPVVDVRRHEYRLGGAANVALNIRTLGADPHLIGVTGNDRYHNELSSLLENQDISSSYLIQDNFRPTTLKSRVISHNQQILRIDNESKNDVNDALAGEIIKRIKDLSSQVDCIIIEDYNKGVLTPDIIETAITEANDKNIVVTVDPKFKNFFEYKNCTLFKPNFFELQKNSGILIENELDMDEAAEKVMKKLTPKYLIVTRGEKGLSVYTKTSPRIDIPTFAQEVYDVSGAGDTVISTISLALSCGIDIEEAALIANHAAGSVCSKIGVHPVYPQDIIKSLSRYNNRRQ